MDDKTPDPGGQHLAEEVRALTEAVTTRETAEAHRAYLEQRLAVAEGLRLTVTQQEHALQDLRDQLDRAQTDNDRLAAWLDHCRSVERDGRRELERARSRTTQLEDELDRIRASAGFTFMQLLALPLRVWRSLLQRMAGRGRPEPHVGGQDGALQSSSTVSADTESSTGDPEQTGPEHPEDPTADTDGTERTSTAMAPEPGCVLLDARGLDANAIGALLTDLDDDGRGRLVVAMDTLDFAAVRQWGVAFEYLPDPAMVADRYGATAAQRVREQRWQEIVEAHVPVEVIHVSRAPDGALETRRVRT